MISHKSPNQINLYDKEKTSLHEKMILTPRQTRGLIMASLALFATIGSGCSKSNTVNDVFVPTQSEAPANPGQNSQPSIVETSVLSGEVEKYVDIMDKYKDLDIDSFEELPRSERLKYPDFLIEMTVSRKNYDTRYWNDSKGKEYAIKPVEVSTKNNGQEIIANNLYALQIAYLQFTETDNGPQLFDSSDGIKTLSSVYYDVGKDKTISQEYSVIKSDMMTLEKPTRLTNQYIAKKTSPLTSGTSKDGEKVKYKDVTYVDKTDTTTWYSRYIYQSYVGYDGTNRSTWLLDATSTNSLNELESISSIR